jgi:hypothetical protein
VRGALPLLAALCLLAPAAAHAQTAGSTSEEGALVAPTNYAKPPAGRVRSANDAIAIARKVPNVQAERAKFRNEYVRAYLKRPGRWQVAWYDPPRGRDDRTEEIIQVLIDDRTGRVEETWTGFQVAWLMARGYPGAFGRKANAPYVWIPLCLLFLLPFARLPLRMVHLDLGVLLAFSIGYAFFNEAEIGVSVPLSYPLLLYLLARMLWVAWRRPPEGAPTWMSADTLGIAIVFLLGFRIGLNLTASNVIDVGYSGVIGADRIAHGEALYGNFPRDNPHGDTYGPAAYLAYLPFELVFPWKGTWDALPAAHGAAILFDLATLALLFLVGRRHGGTRTGALLAYLWVACPWSLLVASSNANDALVGALVLLALFVAGRPLARGGALALAGLTKFAPLALAPLFAAPRRFRFALGFILVAALVSVPVLAPGGLDALHERTIGFQDERGSPFSIWGYYDGLGVLQEIVKWSAVAFALALGVIRTPHDTVGLAALSAAVLIALQLAVTHWFYLYLAWFIPVLLVALVIPRDAGPARSTPPSAAPSTG